MSAQPLWRPDNTSMFSDVFNVPPGKVCLLYATGLLSERVKVEDAEFKVPQAFCVKRLLYEPDLVYGKNATCDWVAVSTSAQQIADEYVQTSNGCWTLTEAHNIGIIGLPGVYRLEINDATAIGTAQVYAEQYDITAIPVHIKDLFFL